MFKVFMVYFVVLVIALGINGWIGSYTWPYTVSTWATYFEADQKPDYHPMSRTMGFWLGACPIVTGPLSIPLAILTGLCDYIFIPDPENVVVLPDTVVETPYPVVESN